MNIRIHHEGYRIIMTMTILLALVNLLTGYLAGTFSVAFYSILAASILLLLFVLRFFRKPVRKAPHEKGVFYAPADGKVVAIEETTEDEYFSDKRLQVSIFMSVWDVHINWYPAGGTIKYYRYHPGKYLVARHPKSSILNERTTIVLETEDAKQVLFRQIAGFVARRVVCYAREKQHVRATDELGFIKFGSRVDLFFPPGTEIPLKIGQKVTGNVTPVGRLN
jgi:phosphatidylserine decarboxylase